MRDGARVSPAIVQVGQRIIGSARIHAAAPQKGLDHASVESRSRLHCAVQPCQTVSRMLICSITKVPRSRNERWGTHSLLCTHIAAAARAVRTGRTYGNWQHSAPSLIYRTRNAHGFGSCVNVLHNAVASGRASGIIRADAHALSC